MIVGVPEIILGDMRMIKSRDIVGIDAYKRVRNIRTPGTQRLDFRSRENEPCLVTFAEFVIP